MEEKALKTWNYHLHHSDYRLEYFKDKIIWTYFLHNQPNPTIYDLSLFFKHSTSIATAEIQHELYKLITQGDCPVDWDELDKKRWAFWQALDEQKIRLEQLPSGKQGKYLVYNQYEVGSEQSDCQSLENFFFFGPRQANLPLATRKRMQKIILEALDASKHSLSLRDAFVLFDYDKIPGRKWKDSSDTTDMGYSEAFAELKGGSFTITRFHNPYDGSSSDYYSIEKIWANRPDFVSDDFIGANDFIEKALSNAIIKED